MVLESNRGGLENSLHISKGVEIVVGQTVPVLQHSKCVGLQGKVKEINLEDKTYSIACTDCNNPVFLDIKTLVG